MLASVRKRILNSDLEYVGDEILKVNDVEETLQLNIGYRN